MPAVAPPSSPAPFRASPRWVFPDPAAEAGTLERELGLPPLIARLLAGRGIATPEAAEAFLDPRLQALSDPFRVAGLKAAAERLAQALARREPVAVFGDYDADGVTSSALLVRVLRTLGADVRAFVPRRISEGYGMTRAALDRCLAEGPKPALLVAVDCGTSSAAEIAWLAERGIETVVIDHHELPPQLPACVLVNPHQDPPGSPWSPLCTVGLVFKVCHGLLKLDPAFRAKVDLRDLLDLVAVGTVADLVPLRGENRILVKHGLLRLDHTGNPGLRALAAVAGVKKPAAPDDVGFRIGPRLNASGRLDDAGDSLRLLITDDPAEAERLARSLDHQNRERQDLEQRTLDEAMALLALEFDESHGTVILGKRGWHVGVVGIVASRLQKLTGRPAIVIGFDEAGDGKGSCRSVEGCPIVDGLRASAVHLDRYGGHEMAAGLSLREEKLGAFRDSFNEWMRTDVPAEAISPRLRLDGELQVSQVGDALFRELGKLAPFGRENPQPLFAFRNVPMARAPQTIKVKHLKLFLGHGSVTCEAIAFGFGERPFPGAPLSIAGALEWDDYKGRVQVRMVDWRTEEKS